MKKFLTFTLGTRRSTHGASQLATAPRPRNVTRRILGAVLLCLGGAAVSHATAQENPARGRIIKIVVPSGPGSALDLLARAYGKAMGDAGINSIVENKPGGDGAIGINSFLASPADGSTVLLVSNSWMSINPVMFPKLPYDVLKDLTPITTLSKAGIVMSMTGSSPFDSVRDFVPAARSNPGKYTCATASPNLRMACEFLQASAGIKLLIVPYKTTAAAYMAVGSGEADIVFADAGSSLVHWSSGRVKPMAATTPERIPSLPKIPTTREQGLPDFLMSAWYGAYFKSGTSPDKVAAMREVLRKAGESPSVKTSLQTFVHEPWHLTGNDVTDMNRKEIEMWTKLVRDHGIKFSE